MENVGVPLSYEILRSGKHIVKTKVVNTFDSEAGYIMKVGLALLMLMILCF